MLWNMKASTNTRDLAYNRRADCVGVCHQNMESIELNEGMSGPYSQSSVGQLMVFSVAWLKHRKWDLPLQMAGKATTTYVLFSN
jgi:hypothetical protein